ncbi:MAG: hypothetical protein RL226_766 [Bacteroidota bacterium]|jgi:chromosome segregation ATPase
MKTLILLSFCTILAASSIAQQTPSIPVGSYTSEEYKSRVSEINKELAKMDRALVREARAQRQKEQQMRDAERELEYNRLKQEEKEKHIAQLRSDMAGWDLDALEEKIARLSRERSKLDRQAKNDAQAIIRKKAQIEKLLAEIAMLEQRIDSNEQVIDQKDNEIQQTEEIITSNALVTRQAEIDQLEDDIEALKAQESRLIRKKDQSADGISEAEHRIRALEIQRKLLQEEKRQKEQLLQVAKS